MAGILVARQEQHADRVVTLGRQIEVGDGAEERVRDLQQQAGAVAGTRVGTDGAAVMQPLEDRQALADDLVAFFALDMRDKTDAAGIVFVRRVVQPLFRRQGTVTHRTPLLVCWSGPVHTGLDTRRSCALGRNRIRQELTRQGGLPLACRIAGRAARTLYGLPLTPSPDRNEVRVGRRPVPVAGPIRIMESEYSDQHFAATLVHGSKKSSQALV